jgi:hypothetical protein
VNILNKYSLNATNLDLSNKVVYYDTSILLELTGPSQYPSRQIEVQEFHKNLSTAGGISISSIKGWEEYDMAIKGNYLDDVKNSNPAYANQYNKSIIEQEPSIIKNACSATLKAKELFNEDPSHIISELAIDFDIYEEAFAIQQQANLELPDAIHFVMAQHCEADYFAALDRDYLRLLNGSLNTCGIDILLNSYTLTKYTRKKKIR